MSKQTLVLADDLMEAARDGHKRVTVRLGKRDIKLGALTFTSAVGTRKPIRTTVVRVRVCKQCVMPKWALGGLTHEDELAVLQRFYPNITDSATVTCIEFRAA